MSRTYTQDQRKALALKIKQLKEQGVKGGDISVQLGIPHGTVNSLLSSFFKPVVTYKKREGVNIEEIGTESETDSKPLDEKNTQLWQAQSEDLESLTKRVEAIEQGLVKVFQKDEELQCLLKTLAEFFRK